MKEMFVCPCGSIHIYEQEEFDKAVSEEKRMVIICGHCGKIWIKGADEIEDLYGEGLAYELYTNVIDRGQENVLEKFKNDIVKWDYGIVPTMNTFNNANYYNYTTRSFVDTTVPIDMLGDTPMDEEKINRWKIDRVTVYPYSFRHIDKEDRDLISLRLGISVGAPEPHGYWELSCKDGDEEKVLEDIANTNKVIREGDLVNLIVHSDYNDSEFESPLSIKEGCSKKYRRKRHTTNIVYLLVSKQAKSLRSKFRVVEKEEYFKFFPNDYFKYHIHDCLHSFAYGEKLDFQWLLDYDNSKIKFGDIIAVPYKNSGDKELIKYCGGDKKDPNNWIHTTCHK